MVFRAYHDSKNYEKPLRIWYGIKTMAKTSFYDTVQLDLNLKKTRVHHCTHTTLTAKNSLHACERTRT